MKKKHSAKTTWADRFFNDRVTVGLDIGESSIKLVEVKRTSRGLGIEKYVYHERAERAADGNESEQLGNILSQIWKANKIKPRRVRVAVSHRAMYLRHLTIPRVPEEELSKAIKWQAEKYTPFPIETAAVDFQPALRSAEAKEDGMDVILVALENRIVDSYLTALKAARLFPLTLSVAPFAVLDAVMHCFPVNPAETRLIIDLGSGTSSIVVHRGEDVLLARGVDFGSDSLTRELAQGLNMSGEQAEKIKRTEGLDSPDSSPGNDCRVYHLLEPPLLALVEQVNRSLAYCEKVFLVESINKVVLCGGGALLKGLDRFLAAKLGLPVEVWAAGEEGGRVHNVSRFLAGDDLPKMAAALGMVF